MVLTVLGVSRAGVRVAVYKRPSRHQPLEGQLSSDGGVVLGFIRINLDLQKMARVVVCLAERRKSKTLELLFREETIWS